MKYNCIYCQNELIFSWSPMSNIINYYDCFKCPIILRYRFDDNRLTHISVGIENSKPDKYPKCDMVINFEEKIIIISIYYDDKYIFTKIPLIENINPQNYKDKISIYLAFN